VTYANRPQGATTGAWPGYQAFGGWKGSGNTGKAIASFYYCHNICASNRRPWSNNQGVLMRPPISAPPCRGEGAALLARDVGVTTPSLPRDYPFVMAKGRGAEVWDIDGNRFLDFASGIAVCSTGHAHPAVVQAIKEAADEFLHISSDYWHERLTRLAEKINALDRCASP